MRLQLSMSDQDDQARHKQLELLRSQNQAIELSQENKRQGARATLYAGSSAVIAGVLLFTLLFQTARDRRRLRRMSRRDGLTGLLNHTRFFELALQNFQRAQQTGTSFTLIVADVDLFKQVNDSHGHLIGDEVLR
ncbi:MAG: diguanylate cyclase, partial [Wenzhouxiangellaceae bacterium]